MPTLLRVSLDKREWIEVEGDSYRVAGQIFAGYIRVWNPNNTRIENYPIRVDVSKIIEQYGRSAIMKITDEVGNPVDFCYENANGKCTDNLQEWDGNYIWMKVSLNANEERVYQVEGYKKVLTKWYPASTATSPRRIFIFYDDFIEFTGWERYGYGDVTQDTSKFGYPVLAKINNCDPNGGWKSIGVTLDRYQQPFRLEAMIWRDKDAGRDCYADRIGIVDNNANGYGPYMAHSYTGQPTFGIDIRTNGSPTTHSETINYDPLSEWYTVELILDGDIIISKLYKGNFEELIKSYSLTNTAYRTFTRVYVFGGRPYYVNWIRIRPYARYEPQAIVQLQREEQVTYSMA